MPMGPASSARSQRCTVRCDGDSEPGAAFGGPMYYGHSPNGYSERNVFNYQTRSVLSVYQALSEEQRKKAVVTGSPGEGAPSIKFKQKIEEQPGILYKDLILQRPVGGPIAPNLHFTRLISAPLVGRQSGCAGTDDTFGNDGVVTIYFTATCVRT